MKITNVEYEYIDGKGTCYRNIIELTKDDRVTITVEKKMVIEG